MHVLALDVGTSSVKAAVLDGARAAPLGEIAHVGYELDRPRPEAAEIAPEKLWAALAAAARQAMRGVETVAGVGLSCLTPALVLLDERDRPLGPFWTHLDRRSRQAARQVWAGVGDEFLATTGNRPLPGGISAVCYRQQLTDTPYLYRRVRSYLHLNGWLGLRLTGEKAMDRANASFSGLYNTVTDRQWSPKWCDFFNVEPAWLPRLVDGRDTLGTLRPEVAGELGVPPGVPVKLGTADTSSAALAACLRPGDLLHEVGTTQVLATLVDRPAPDPRRLVRELGVGDGFLHVTHNPVGGVALDWLYRLCFRDQSEDDFFARTVPEALGRDTRVTLDPPYLGGDRLEIEAHRAGFRDLTLEADRLDLLAALLQEMRRQHYRAVQALGCGERFGRVFLSGGGAAVVRRLIPEYAGAAVHPLEEGSLHGVAWLFG
jgi:sugar (pentulose or hexulose) kinase